MSDIKIDETLDESTKPTTTQVPEELSDKELEDVSGGRRFNTLNPQPLPPFDSGF